MTRTDQFDSPLSYIVSQALQRSNWVILLLVCTSLIACQTSSSGKPKSHYPTYANASIAKADSSASHTEAPVYEQYADLKVPPLPPEKALKTFKLEDGFHIEMVAHEPDIVDPVAMDIDPDGRLWVVEMRSYMPVYDKGEKETSKLERVPESRIIVLEDTTGDGRMDHSWVFMDKLTLPRSIKVLDDGVLIAEPPHLWFVQDTTGDGVGDTKELVYNHFGKPMSDNVEHMDNGLMWGMDNWIYSIYSNVSFRHVNGSWKTRPFEQLTQWGITQDSWGRIYSSHNSRTLTTHLIPYGYSHRHPDFNLEEGINKNIAASETMWPAHPTGVNRGYQVGQIVRKDGTLKRSTATCGPVIYRGDQFGKQYRGNAFVAEPAGNLIKRLVGIDDNPGDIDATARFAYKGREFLTSTDERFRPVHLYNAPDGSIYVLDMYRGIFQHARYLTDFLRNYAIEHDLNKPAGKSRFGRIYRIVRDDRPIDYNSPHLGEKEPDELVNYLENKNGLLRDIAQQLLVQRSPSEVIPRLEKFVQDKSAPYYTRLQALWTLEGFNRNRYDADRLSDIALIALKDPHPRIRAAAMRILEPEIKRNSPDVMRRLEQVARKEAGAYPLLQLLASLGQSIDSSAVPAIAAILNKHSDSPYFREMALNGVYQQETELLKVLQHNYNWQKGQSMGKDWVIERLEKASKGNSNHKLALKGTAQQLYELGKQQFQACTVCHGVHGQGIEGVAPALDSSQWVNGDPKALIRILINGLQGGIDKHGKEITGVMPSHQYFSDKEVAAVLTYIRNSWSNNAPPITIKKAHRVRNEIGNRNKEWTREELRNLSK